MFDLFIFTGHFPYIMISAMYFLYVLFFTVNNAIAKLDQSSNSVLEYRIDEDCQLDSVYKIPELKNKIHSDFLFPDFSIRVLIDETISKINPFIPSVIDNPCFCYKMLAIPPPFSSRSY